jgi:hypothetical protein
MGTSRWRFVINDDFVSRTGSMLEEGCERNNGDPVHVCTSTPATSALETVPLIAFNPSGHLGD